VRRVGKELNVRYVLEGSVQRTEDRLRMNVQLVEADTARRVWAERFDRPLDDLFAVQDEIVDRVVTELDVALVRGQQARDWRRSTRNRQAHELFLRAMQHYDRFTQQDFARAEALMEEALTLDPECALCIAVLGWTYMNQGDSGWERPAQESYKRALEMARRATTIDPRLGLAHTLEGSVLLTLQRFEEAMAANERALAATPNQGNVVANTAWNFAFGGRAEEAYTLMQRAFRLNPFAPAWYYGALGESLVRSGRIEEAVAALHKCVDPLPDFLMCRLSLTLAYAEADRIRDAAAQAKEALRISPAIRADSNPSVLSTSSAEARGRAITAFRQAGLP